MGNTKLDDSVLFVDYENSHNMKGWVPRRLGGGFGGDKKSGQLRFGGRDRPFKPPIQLPSSRTTSSQYDLKHSRHSTCSKQRHSDQRHGNKHRSDRNKWRDRGSSDYQRRSEGRSRDRHVKTEDDSNSNKKCDDNSAIHGTC